jgi:ABC-type polysaccharide/polyol phosphate export permease
MAIEQRTALARTGAGATGAPKPVLEVTGGPGGISADSLRELWAFREVLWAFTVRQVKIRYKQMALGVGWAVLQPVLAAAIFALFLGRFTGLGSEGVPYLVFALAGMVVWTYFSTAAGNGANSLLANDSMLRKLYFPREILPLSAVIASLVDLIPGLFVLAVVAGLYGYAPSIAWFALPLVPLVLVLFAAAFSFGFSAINVYYRDVKYVLPFVLQVGLFASPVVYSLDTVPAGWRNVYATLNPVAAAIDAVRRIMLHAEWPLWTPTLCAIVWSLLLIVGTITLFKRLERGFADRI